MAEKPTPKQDVKQQGKKPKGNFVLMAAIDDLLGMQKQAEDALKNANEKPGKVISETEATILQHYEEGLQKTLDLIAPAGMEITNKEVLINDLYARTLYVYNWPNYTYPNWLSSLVNFDAEMIISHYIYPSSNKVIMKMLRKKVTEMRASIRMLEQKGIVRDPTLEAALQDAEELRDLLARGREKLFQFGMYVTIYAEDEEKLKKLETDVESLLGGKLVLTKPAMFQMEHAWLSTLPLCQDELEITRNMNTSPLATSFPFSSSDLTDDHGILYGINRHNDSLVIFDRFDLPNANSTVFATSGAGKSYTVKLELLRYMMFNTEVFVLDPENEYVDLAKSVGGTYVPMSLQSQYRINPFDLPKAVRGDDARKGETLRAAIINLHGLFKLMLGTLTPAEDGVLDKAIMDTYALRNITIDTEDPQSMEPPTMHDLVDVLSTTEGGEHMAQTLSKYTEGSYSGIFDKHTNVELDNQMVVFQIRDLEEQLRPVAMYIILQFLWNRVRAELKRRILVIDEAWNLLQYEDSARFLYGLIKRARKYFLGVTTITQDVEDFVNSPYGKPIITNSSFTVLLKQSASAVDNLQKLFYLTDGEKYLLLNSNVGQGIFFAGSKHVAIQIVASPAEDKIITTKPEEMLKRQEEKKAEAKQKKEAQEEQDAIDKLSEEEASVEEPDQAGEADEEQEPEEEEEEGEEEKDRPKSAVEELEADGEDDEYVPENKDIELVGDGKQQSQSLAKAIGGINDDPDFQKRLQRRLEDDAIELETDEMFESASAEADADEKPVDLAEEDNPYPASSDDATPSSAEDDVTSEVSDDSDTPNADKSNETKSADKKKSPKSGKGDSDNPYLSM